MQTNVFLFSVTKYKCDLAHARIVKEIKPWLNQAKTTGMLGKMALQNNGEYNWTALAYACSKMVSGYRLGGRHYEDWIMKELRVPRFLRNRFMSNAVC